MDSKYILFLTALFSLVFHSNPHAGKSGRQGSASLMGSYSKTTYGPDTYSTGRRITTALAYNLTDVTEIEISYTYSKSLFKQAEIQSITEEEQTLSGSVIQTLVPPDWVFQPYAKGGAAQYNRKQNGTVSGIPTREVYTKSPSFLLGVGARVFFLQNFALKVEAIEYFPDFKFNEGANNIAVEGGLSYYF